MASRAPDTLRADAHRNRERLLAAAIELLVTGTPALPLEDVARGAGVGIATLYRHFPDRRALLMALVERSGEALLSEMRATAARAPSAWDALVATLDWSPRLHAVLRLTGAMSPDGMADIAARPSTRALRADLERAFGAIVTRAQAAGDVRTDVTAADVLALVTWLFYGVRAGAIPDEFDRARRVILAGLRPAHRPASASATSPTRPPGPR